MSGVLIAYASKTGTAKEAAEQIAHLVPDSDLIDLTRDTPDLDRYDAAIIGGGVRMGKMHKDAQKFIHDNASALSRMKTAYFITNCLPDTPGPAFAEAVPETIKAKEDVICLSVGGRMDLDRLKGMDKVVGKMAMRANGAGEANAELDMAAIHTLAKFVQ